MATCIEVDLNWPISPFHDLIAASMPLFDTHRTQADRLARLESGMDELEQLAESISASKELSLVAIPEGKNFDLGPPVSLFCPSIDNPLAYGSKKPCILRGPDGPANQP
jgi:hypothetical protein